MLLCVIINNWLCTLFSINMYHFISIDFLSNFRFDLLIFICLFQSDFEPNKCELNQFEKKRDYWICFDGKRVLVIVHAFYKTFLMKQVEKFGDKQDVSVSTFRKILLKCIFMD